MVQVGNTTAGAPSEVEQNSLNFGTSYTLQEFKEVILKNPNAEIRVMRGVSRSTGTSFMMFQSCGIRGFVSHKNTNGVFNNPQVVSCEGDNGQFWLLCEQGGLEEVATL